jgi:hypothetical protein
MAAKDKKDEGISKADAEKLEEAKADAVAQEVEKVEVVAEQQASNQDPRLMHGDNEDVDTANPQPGNPDYHGGPAYEPK